VLAHAAKTLEIVYKSSASPRDLFNLSQLHRVAGNRKASRESLNALMAQDSMNIYYLTTALEELTEDRNIPAGETFAERLTSKYPGEFRAVAAVARFECKAGRADRALALAEGYAGAADTGAGDYLSRAARVAELLDEIARYPNVRGSAIGHKITAAAVERYTALAPTRPEALVGIAGLLAADGKVTEAFGKIEEASRNVPGRVRALAGLAALRSGGATERQFALVKTWLDDASREDPEAVPLLLNVAEFRTLQQDYAGAANTYETILKCEPRSVVALNNLAWLIAADPAQANRALELLERAMREAGLTGDLLDTRARVRMTLKQLPQAERDLKESMKQEATGLRYFHRSLLRLAQSPANHDEALKDFREGRSRGLDSRIVHPADLPTYRVLEAEERRTKKD
jgi:tetratricopeptide (TPR) repeat protein